jgi:SAM-dependent methyltransferase
LRHDRQKQLLLPVGGPDSFLQAIGIMNREGKVRPRMRRKFRQINEFLRLMTETGELKKFDHVPLKVVDCGCGNAYLTFAAYHYLNHILGLPTELTGIDVRDDLLKQQSQQSRELGWAGLTFQPASIIDFQPATPPDIVLALHACDTATDEALAQGIKWQSQMILSAPCCHHHLQQQLNRQPAPEVFEPVMHHGILKERLGDILTDTLRALILRILGYRAEVIEFISTEHTDKNLMIRAVKTEQAGSAKAIQEYQELKLFWQVRPYLEELLQTELESFL